MSCEDPEESIFNDLPARETNVNNIEILRIDPERIKEEDDIVNPFCIQSVDDVKCNRSLAQCYNYNRRNKLCKHYKYELSENQNYLRLMEIEHLDQLKNKYEHKVKRIKHLQRILEKRSDIFSIIGCGGCLLWIALMIVVLAGGVYAIKWACFLFKCAWNVQL